MPLAAPLIVVALVSGCIYYWVQAAARRRRGAAIVEYEPRRPVPWNVGLVCLTAIIFVLVRDFGVFSLRSKLLKSDLAIGEALQGPEAEDAIWRNPSAAAALFQITSLTNVVVLLVTLVVLVRFARAELADLGWSVRRLTYDARLGVAAFFAAAVPAMLIQALLQKLIAPSQHPIIQALGGDEIHGRTLFWAALAAIVVAPPVEEFLFRGVLQGWLEQAFAPPPVVLSSPLEGEVELLSEPVTPTTEAAAFAPIFISSAVFALVHWPNGVDVAGLFLFAIGLGYVYRQTHRLWPGIVAHAILNAFSTAMLVMNIDG